MYGMNFVSLRWISFKENWLEGMFHLWRETRTRQPELTATLTASYVQMSQTDLETPGETATF